MDAYLGIDAGTTALKAALFDANGRLIALDRQEYALLTPGPSLVELDAEVYWQACCRAVTNVVGRARGSPIAEPNPGRTAGSPDMTPGTPLGRTAGSPDMTPDAPLGRTAGSPDMTPDTPLGEPRVRPT